MKILHIGKFFYPYRGGMENFLTDLAIDQSSRGIETAVIVHHHDPLKSSSQESVDGVEVNRILSLGQLVYAPVAPSFGYHLWRLLHRFKPDIVHLHLPNLSALWILLFKKKIPVIIQWQSDVVRSKVDVRLSLFYPAYRVFEKKLLERAQAIIVSSENYFQGSEILWPHKQKCVTIPLGINPGRIYRPGREEILRLKGRFDKFLVLSVGRFTYYKGFEFLIEAAKKVTEACFVMIGEGPLKNKLQRKLDRAGLADRVFLPGSLPDRELHTLMAACDVFCLPSIERTEAFGIALLEAMAFGKPLITTDIAGSGVSWVNLAGKTGLVVQAADGTALAQAIKYLHRHSEARLEMGDRAYERFNRLFQIKKISQEIMNVYSSFQTQPVLI